MSTLESNFNLSKKYSREIKSLLVFVCKRDLSWLLSHSEYELNDQEEVLFKQAYELLLTGTPLAYITSEQAFYNYNFKVSPKVLIPRPETELIVDIAIESIVKSQEKAACLDIGTGSGALITSIASELQKKDQIAFKNCAFMAGDISTDAIKQAKINAQAYGLDNRINFLAGNLFTPFIDLIRRHNIRYLFIAANLPYLTKEEREGENSIKAEPDLALLGGKDGLELYLELLQQLKKYQDEFNFHLVMEINPWQAEKLIQASANNLSDINIKKTPDLNGQTRFIELNNRRN
ncbi:MAG: peptide chain release factor N(5)-glutamine methyltransferase [Patescibacteria group bacterium]|nr:peptide chain release factor N(5)-glutamine methyltransferase [Patescibacteria group bacterium]